MDFTTFVGIIVFFGFVIGSVVHSEGLEGLQIFLNPEAFFVVLGGTFCALLVNYPLKEILNLRKVIFKVLFLDKDDTSNIVSTFVGLSQRAKKDGFLSLQEDVNNIPDDFLKRAVQLVIDGADQDFIRNMLETELNFIGERHKVGRGIMNALGTYAPAFGIIGTVLGMILMLGTISEVEEVPRRMALALTAAFMGLGAGYLLFLPMAGKLHARSTEEILVKEIIIRGVLLLQSGAAPSVVEANLKAYLDPASRVAVKVQPQGV